MTEFKQYRRKSISEMRPYQEGEILDPLISISQADKDAGSPKEGDMIARNPDNHSDQWLMAKDYFEKNLEPLTSQPSLSVSEKEVEENEKVKIYSEIIRDLKRLRDNIGKPLAPKEISDEEIMAKANEWNDMFLMGLDDIDIQQFAEKLGKWYRDKLKP